MIVKLLSEGLEVLSKGICPPTTSGGGGGPVCGGIGSLCTVGGGT